MDLQLSKWGATTKRHRTSGSASRLKRVQRNSRWQLWTRRREQVKTGIAQFVTALLKCSRYENAKPKWNTKHLRLARKRHGIHKYILMFSGTLCIVNMTLVFLWEYRTVAARPVAARLLGLRLRVPSGAWCVSIVCVVRCWGTGLCDKPISRQGKSYRLRAYLTACDHMPQ